MKFKFLKGNNPVIGSRLYIYFIYIIWKAYVKFIHKTI